MDRRSFLKFAANFLGGTAIAAILGLEYVGFETQWYKVHRLNLSLLKLPPAFQGFTLTHLSDLHINTWTTPERFSEVVELANVLESDVILITGDFIDRTTTNEMFTGIVQQLSSLKARMGVYAVLGNHDHWRDHLLVREILAKSGILDISNKVHTLERGQDRLHLCGLDDFMEGQQDLEAVTSQLNEADCAVLLIHEPDYADISAPTQKFSLQLSGHSHGGQIDIPFYGKPVLPPHGRKYPRGLYQVGEMWLYTSTGVGMVQPRVRFNCRPEIVQFTLT
jgi:predicted MPP superfamily phosphohydrolase